MSGWRRKVDADMLRNSAKKLNMLLNDVILTRFNTANLTKR